MLSSVNHTFKRLSSMMPVTDILQHKESYLLEYEIPGVKKEDITITTNDGVLEIKAKKAAQERKGHSMVRSERFYGDVERSFTIPRGVDVEKIEALLADGVLTVKIPRINSSKIDIKVH